MLRERPSLRAVAERAFADAVDRVAGAAHAGPELEPNEAEQHGALTPARRAACAAQSARAVVAPCARQVLGTATRAGATAAPG